MDDRQVGSADLGTPENVGTNVGEDAALDLVLARFWAVLRRLPRYVALGVGLARDDRVPAGAKTAVVLGGAYAVSPIDLVPGIIPIAGQLDDMIVLLVALRRAVRACPPAVAAEHLQRAGLTAGDFDADLAACRATVRWLAIKGWRIGRRLARGTGRRVWSVVQARVGAGG